MSIPSVGLNVVWITITTGASPQRSDHVHDATVIRCVRMYICVMYTLELVYTPEFVYTLGLVRSRGEPALYSAYTWKRRQMFEGSGRWLVRHTEGSRGCLKVRHTTVEKAVTVV